MWYHAEAFGYHYATAGLSAFLLLSTYLEARRAPAERLQISFLAARVLLPWAFWFAVFALLALTRGAPVIPTDHGVLAGVLYGSYGHLWYLPLIFVATLLVRFAGRTSAWSVVICICAAIAIVTLVTIPLWREPSLGLGAPIAQYAKALAPTLLGPLLAARY